MFMDVGELSDHFTNQFRNSLSLDISKCFTKSSLKIFAVEKDGGIDIQVVVDINVKEGEKAKGGIIEINTDVCGTRAKYYVEKLEIKKRRSYILERDKNKMKVKELKEVINSIRSRDDGREISLAFDEEVIDDIEIGWINCSDGILILINPNKTEVKKLDETISN